MSGVSLTVAPTSSPDDTAALSTLTAQGASAADVLAVIGKTEGNGCVNDFSRTLAAAAWDPLLPDSSVTIFSGGTEGVLSPHTNLLVRDPTDHPGHDRGLVAAVGRTRAVASRELGRPTQLTLVAEVVRTLVSNLGVTSDDVHLVLVKCPLLGPASNGPDAPHEDGYESMARSRAASSLGIAVALDECTEADAINALNGQDTVWSSRASASSGAELNDCHVVVLATSTAARNPLRAVHGVMRDAIDLPAVTALLDQVHAQGGTLVQIFAKAEADPTGTVRGHRHTMLTDSDLNPTRHARAAVGGLLAAARGNGAVYVSGGAEHQGPPGGGSITLVFTVAATATNNAQS